MAVWAPRSPRSGSGRTGHDAQVNGAENPAHRARVLSGPRALAELGQGLDDLHAAVRAPVTARRPWLETWARCFTDHEPWIVCVESLDGRLEGVAPLARRRGRGLTTVVALGHGPSDQVRLAARDPSSATALASAVARALRGIQGPWRLRVEQVPEADPVVGGIAALLPNAALVPGDAAPTLRLDRGRDPSAYISRNSRQVASSKRNRMRRAGLEISLDVTRDPGRIEAILPEIERVHRRRDAALVRRSDLDDPRAAAFWREVISLHAGRGEVQVVELRLSGRLAAYVLGFLDQGAFRMWDGRFDPDFSQVSAGRVAMQEAVAAVVRDEALHEFDWMRGEEPYKLRLCSEVVPARHLLAWSSPLVRAADRWPARTRDALRDARDRSPALRRAWLAAKARILLRGPRR